MLRRLALVLAAAAQLAAQSPFKIDSYLYDGLGNITQAGTDTFVYDEAGRVTMGTAGAGRRQDYTYDAFGNIRTITTDGNVSAQRKLGANPADNRVSLPGSQGYNVTCTYDDAGFMTGCLGDTYSYDGTGMMTFSEVQGAQQAYVYGADDERIGTIDLNGANAGTARCKVTLAPLPGDDPAVVAHQLAGTAGVSLDTSVATTAGEFVIVGSDAAVRIIAGHPRVVRVEEVPAALSRMNIDGGAVRPAATPATWTTGTYAYDGSGNVKSVARADFTERYVYDAFGRNTSGTAGPGRSEQHTYDAFGNIATRTLNGSTIVLGANAATNRMDVAGPGINLTGTYDGAGRLETVSSTGASFTYDPLDATSETTIDGVRKVHLYNASEERIASVTVVNNVPSSWSWTIRDGGGRVLRNFATNGAGLVWREDYIYRDGQLLAAEVDAPEKRRQFHPDHLGTPRLITGNGGAQIGLHTYYPFGTEATAGQEGEPKKFTGHERDAANLDYMHARYYAPAWGRFLSVDPVLDVEKSLNEPRRWNRYAYVINNPLRFTDPDGREIYAQVHEVTSGSTDLVTEPANHVSIRIEPNDQAAWANDARFSNVNPDTGRRYATIGAGPQNSIGSLAGRGGALVAGVNRPTDVNLSNKVSVKLDLGGRNENKVIAGMFAATAAYKNDKPYALKPQASSKGYNSNSFASGLMLAVLIQPPTLRMNVPGYSKPLPLPSPCRQGPTAPCQ